MVCLGNMCMATLHKGDNDAIIIIIIIIIIIKLALPSPTGGGRSVGIVRSRTKATEFSLV